MDMVLSGLIEAWRSKGFQSVLQIFVWLCSINAGFWILARAMGAFVDVFSELFWEDVWGALATVYNIALALVFAAVIFASATKGALPKDFLWREMCGFVLLYMALGASYMDAATHQINEYARPGYALGLIGYILFAAFPRIIAHPELFALVAALKALADSWIGRALTVFMVGGIVWGIARRGLREMFYHLSPFLWFIGALKHPPIRIRRN
ncbi:MAG: hypothetical protein PHS14_12125 [Elusimicrobia bacterium]|nr:hypothetical protein [Elusimicrobiota bacterium]